MTSRGVSIYPPLLPVNTRQYGFLRALGMSFATIDSLDTTEPRGPLEVFFIGERSRSFRRCLHHRLNRAVDVADSYASRIGKPIFVAKKRTIEESESNGALTSTLPSFSNKFLKKVQSKGLLSIMSTVRV